MSVLFVVTNFSRNNKNNTENTFVDAKQMFDFTVLLLFDKLLDFCSGRV
jgi:hypothetical protein